MPKAALVQAEITVEQRLIAYIPEYAKQIIEHREQVKARAHSEYMEFMARVQVDNKEIAAYEETPIDLMKIYPLAKDLWPYFVIINATVFLFGIFV